MYERIVVPLDGSKLAERALPHAEELARLTGAPLHVVQVVDSSPLGVYDPFGGGAQEVAQLIEDSESAAREYLHSVATRRRASDLVVTTSVRVGSVAREILNEARHGDVIVIASHGRSGVTRWFLGSVAEEIMRRSPVPVMVIRAQPPAPDRPAHSLPATG